jgi:hypothetical protein
MNTQPKFLSRASPLAQAAIDAPRQVAQAHGLEVATRVVAEALHKPFAAERERACVRRSSLLWLAGLLPQRSRPSVDPVHPKPAV